MLGFVRTAASRQSHIAKAAALNAVARAPGTMRAFSGVPKTMKVYCARARSRSGYHSAAVLPILDGQCSEYSPVIKMLVNRMSLAYSLANLPEPGTIQIPSTIWSKMQSFSWKTRGRFGAPPRLRRRPRPRLHAD